jgi:hypothetical protein
VARLSSAKAATAVRIRSRPQKAQQFVALFFILEFSVLILLLRHVLLSSPMLNWVNISFPETLN